MEVQLIHFTKNICSTCRKGLRNKQYTPSHIHVNCKAGGIALSVHFNNLYSHTLNLWFSLHTLHCRVLSLHGCQTVVIEMKLASYVLKVIP